MTVARHWIDTRARWLAVGGVLGLACLNPSDGCGCPPTPATAVVFGRVQTASGAPVARAVVSTYIGLSGNCSRHQYPDGATQTGSDGTYGVEIIGVADYDSTCVIVDVQAPEGGGRSGLTDTIIDLEFRYQPPIDSARLDATLTGSGTAGEWRTGASAGR